VLGTTPNELLGFDNADAKTTKRTQLIDRLIEAAKAADDRELEIFVVQTEAVTLRRGRSGTARRSRQS
jgi:hypothetical protein